MSAQKTFKMDGRDIPFSDGQTIMDAALAAGEYIPHLATTRNSCLTAAAVSVWWT